MAERIQREAGRLDLFVERRADDGRALRVVDGRVVLALGRLGRGGEKRGGQAVRLAQADRQGVAADDAGLLVGGPAAAYEVAAHDALDGEGF